MATYRLRRWSVEASVWQAPEVRDIHLVGYRNDETEHRVITSPIVDIKGKVITTQSGSVYLLEDIDPEYLRWMQENGINFDPENPIKDKRSK